VATFCGGNEEGWLREPCQARVELLLAPSQLGCLVDKGALLLALDLCRQEGGERLQLFFTGQGTVDLLELELLADLACLSQRHLELAHVELEQPHSKRGLELQVIQVLPLCQPVIK
jgi:hypothetical protein